MINNICYYFKIILFTTVLFCCIPNILYYSILATLNCSKWTILYQLFFTTLSWPIYIVFSPTTLSCSISTMLYQSYFTALYWPLYTNYSIAATPYHSIPVTLSHSKLVTLRYYLPICNVMHFSCPKCLFLAFSSSLPDC